MAIKPPFSKFYSPAELAAMSTRERNRYERSLKNYWDMLSIEETAKNMRKRELEEAKKQAWNEGFAEGRAEGLAEARDIEIIIRCRKRGMSDAEICDILGVSTLPS